MIGFNRALKLPPQLKWTYAHEPELLGWTIRVRDYSTLVANSLFLGMAVVMVVMSLIIYSVIGRTDPVLRTGSCILFWLFMMCITSSMTHQRMSFAYRFTQSGVEYCRWSHFPERMLTIFKWFAGIAAIVFLFLATLDPVFIVGATIIPVGMGLACRWMAHSKSFRDMHTQYLHCAFRWGSFTQLAIATNREVIALHSLIKMKGEKHKINRGLNIFCARKQKENVADFIKSYLPPKIPVIRARVDRSVSNTLERTCRS